MRYPIPTEDHSRALLSDVDRTYLHETAWEQLQAEFPGMASAMRAFIKRNFTIGEQEAAFDGFTAGLLLLSGAKSTADLQDLFGRAQLPVDEPEAQLT